jgi:small redox-active disulfide protein 2
MKTIHILGSGCAKCNKLYDTTQKVAEELGLEYTLEKITDMMQFANYGVMITPAIVVDGKLKMAGKIPSSDEIKTFLSDN